MSPFRTFIFLYLLIACICLIAGSSLGAIIKIGVFPVRQSSSMSGTKLPDKFLQDLTKIIQSELDKAQVGEIVMLTWPDQLVSADQPTFETLVNRGKEQGCNGVIALQLTTRSFTKKDIKLPIVGQVSTAEALFAISGGLIDVTTSAAITPIKAESKKTVKPYQGPDPNVALRSSFGVKDFDDSLLNKAVNDCIQQVVSFVKEGVVNLTSGSVGIPQRAKAPAGVGFSQDAFQMTMSTGYDKRGTVSVVNRGNQPQTFVIVPKDVPEGFVIGLMGDGSMDGPCTLAPGQWKDIRLVANAPEPVDVKSVTLALYSADGKAPSTEGTPADTATMNIQWELVTNKADFVILSQDPVTLTYTCQLKNKTDNFIRYMTVKLPKDQQHMATITPNLNNACIPGNGSITFYVIPNMFFGMRKLDITLEGSLNNVIFKWPLHFAVPEGKSVYLGMGHTSESSSCSASGCVNQGQLDFETNWKGETRAEFDRKHPPSVGNDTSEDFKWTLRLSSWWMWILKQVNTQEEL
ncbi:MAG: COG1470 family protein, partial [Armatimonadota bacterium]